MVARLAFGVNVARCAPNRVKVFAFIFVTYFLLVGTLVVWFDFIAFSVGPVTLGLFASQEGVYHDGKCKLTHLVRPSMLVIGIAFPVSGTEAGKHL